MEKLFWIAVGLTALMVLAYSLLPSPNFPAPPPGAVQSMEEADIETPLKRAYFTNYTRGQIVDHYKNQFRYRVLTLRLNYPPEDAQTLIRDQTRSAYLEELVHPLRESLFINGFIPKELKDDIWYKGVHYEEKITIKYMPSSIFVRVPIALVSVLCLGLVLRELVRKNNA
ncbi:MAG: hypothetical protein AAB656_00340 [Patescibacteria group bacterium]